MGKKKSLDPTWEGPSTQKGPNKVQVFTVEEEQNLCRFIDVYTPWALAFSELNEYARTLTSSLVLNVSNDREYISKIEASKLPQLPNGTRVAKLTHGGNCIERKFHETELGRNLYICVASSEYLIKDHLFLGDFIIIQADGTEVDPNELLSIPLSKTFCFIVISINFYQWFMSYLYKNFCIGRLFKICRPSSEFFKRKTLRPSLMAAFVHLEKEGPMFWWKTKVYSILITTAMAIFLILRRCWEMLTLSVLKHMQIWSTNFWLPDTLSISSELDEILLKIQNAFQYQSKKIWWILNTFFDFCFIFIEYSYSSMPR